MTKRQIRLNSGAVFLRCAGACFALLELIAWQWVRRIPAPPRTRLLVFLFHKRATPGSLHYALVFAVLATFVLDLLVRLFLRPLVQYWHAPWTDGAAGLFHVDANEPVLASSPAPPAAPPP